MSDPIFVDTQEDSVVEIQVYDYPAQKYKELRIDSLLGNIKIILDEKQADILAKKLEWYYSDILRDLAPEMMDIILTMGGRNLSCPTHTRLFGDSFDTFSASCMECRTIGEVQMLAKKLRAIGVWNE